MSLLPARRVAAGAPGCPADVNGDTVVGVDDLLMVINAWGPNPGSPADVTGDGDVNIDDLLAVIAGWGPCAGAPPVINAELAGVTLTGYPYFNRTVSFNATQSVQLAVDPSQLPTLAGATADVYVVADRTAAQWAADATLVDVRLSGFQTETFAGADVQSNTITIDSGTLSGNAGTGVGVGYDVVIDANQNGMLDGGDVIDGADGAGFFVVNDLTVSGPLAVSSSTYSGGSFLGQRLYYPTNIASLGVLPVVVISHGNGMQYTWYDYLQSHLASYGYVVMSHQNNTVPGSEAASVTTITNTNYLLANLATIAGGVLNGHVDSHQIVWIGHSRGGEGVVRAYDKFFDGTASAATFGLADIKLVIAIAPTDFLGTANSNPHSVPFHLLYGSADGDVCGCPDNDVADSFNLFERAIGPRSSTYVHGADHNDFNCCGVNDFAGPAGTAIGSAEAQKVSKSVFLALIKYTLEGNLAAKDYLWRQWEVFKPQGVSAATIVANELKGAAIDPTNIVIDDYQTQTSTALSSSGGAVTFDVLNMAESLSNDINTTYTWLTSDPMNGLVRGRTSDTGRCAVFDYNAPTTPAFIEFQVVPAISDWSGKAAITLRAAQGTRHPDTVAILGDLTFKITLRDVNNVSSTINIGAYGGGVEEPYLRTGYGTGSGWQDEFEVIRVRLADFLTNGSTLDLSNIAALRLELGGPDTTARGRIALDDIIVTSN